MQTWNAAPYVSAAIESILLQTFADFEFIIVDGGSTDETTDIIHRYARLDDRIAATFLNGRRGRAACANMGVAAARAPLIARMDADDLALPERFARQTDWMRRRDLAVCGTHADEFGGRASRLAFPESHRGVEVELCFRIGLLQPTTIIRTDVLRARPYADTAFEDYELWIRLAPDCRLGNLPEVLHRHRVHPRQCSIVERSALLRDVARYRFAHVYRLFPGAPLADYLALAHMSDRLPAVSAPELARAGAWLVTLARPREWRLRRSMVGRWIKTCDRATAAGLDVSAVRPPTLARLEELAAELTPS